ncbi:hypothetical protein MD484_g7974, partial [Candolleomyces efflorescens]
MYSDMPGLVDPEVAFHPPPPGVSQGGQPGGFYDAFPGAAAAQQQKVTDPRLTLRSSGWPMGYAPPTPFPPSAGTIPSWAGPTSASLQPNSAASWTFGQQQYPPFNNPTFNNTPALTWGGQTPAGSYGPPLTPTGQNSAPPFGGGAGGGGGYTPWSAPAYGPPGQDGITGGGFFGAAPANGQGLGVGWGEPVGKERKQRKRTVSMKRSKSAGPSPPKNQMQRSNSFGTAAASPFGQSVFGYQPWGYYPPAYMMNGDAYGPKNLARRPRDWRADYTPRSGLAAVWPNIVGRSRSDVQEYTDTTRRSLHPLLQYHMQNPPIDHDLRENPFTVDPDNLFLNIGRPYNNIDFAQLATTPPSPFMRIFHPSLPWYIDVRPAHPNGVTVYDVLAQMYRQLMSPITGRHYWNEDLTEEDRKAITLAFQRRCGTNAQEIQRGVVQVDYMGKKVIFEGFVKAKGGMWEMKTSRYE